MTLRYVFTTCSDHEATLVIQNVSSMAETSKWTCHVFCVVFQLLIVIVVTFNFNEQRHCKHVYPTADEVVSGVHIDPPHKVRKRSIDQPLRILLSYDRSVYQLAAEKLELINNTILPNAVNFWEKALMVRKSENVIRLNRKCDNSQVFVKNSHMHCIGPCKGKTMCGEVPVPEKHLDVCRTCNKTGQNCGVMPGSVRGRGIDDADFIFYVSAMQTDRCNKGLTVAYASHCQQEAALDRPIAGHANLCPLSISTKPQELETLLSTVKHEILHALGFSLSLYAFFRDSDGNPLTPRKPDTGKPPLDERLLTHRWSDKIIKTVERNEWVVRGGMVQRTIHMMVTPRVVKEARDYFNCPELEGAELEDQGEDGTALTHWEKRVFENEAMTGTHTQNPVISRLTLALMEDTGWYSANYSLAEEMVWGRGLGCDFVMKSCKEWMDIKASSRNRSHPFCNKVKRDPLQTECTDDRKSVALCNLVEHPQELPDVYQNFDYIQYVDNGKEGYYGGSVSLADYCPYVQEFTWLSKNVSIRGSQCQYIDNSPHENKNFALESYGSDSRCFDHTNQMWEERSCGQVRQWLHWGSGCYRYSCAGGRLHIVVSNYTYTCYYFGQEISIRIVENEWLHRGGIVCPRCRSFCGDACRDSTEAPPPDLYHRDDLHCGSAPVSSAFLLILCAGVLSTAVS